MVVSPGRRWMRRKRPGDEALLTVVPERTRTEARLTPGEHSGG